MIDLIATMTPKHRCPPFLSEGASGLVLDDICSPAAAGDDAAEAEPPYTLSKFETLLSCNPPILESFLLQSPTTTIFQLYHTSSYLRHFLRSYPTAWKYLSFRLLQPSSPTTSGATTTDSNGNTVPRQSRNYALDQLLLTVVNPFSSCLTSLELDNTAVSGQILTSTVLSLRRETLEHLSVRGCKNVSLKYHIVPWLNVFGLALDVGSSRPSSAHMPREFQKLALKSLYTYRCRHHRRRPYLPSSLLRKDSDSEPTHELVNICHKLGIWTDTAWCTSPGARCFRRRGYVTMRVPQNPGEVWVVYDRLWRSKNWIGSVDDSQAAANSSRNKRIRDGRTWEQDEEGIYGEAIGIGDKRTPYREGKFLPMHLRRSHRDFVEDIGCDNCSAQILERCEQCSVLMHCVGCRRTLCASCAFERPYLRNRKSADLDEETKDKFWWAPGCLVSPCSMQDQDDAPNGPGQNPPTVGSVAPVIKFKWCCTEPIFSGGGGITVGPGVFTRDVDRIRASPLPKGHGWEDYDFQSHGSNQIQKNLFSEVGTPGAGSAHQALMRFFLGPAPASHVPRNLCDECYSSKQWRVACKGCSLNLCLEHDLRGLRLRICGYRDLATEKAEAKAKQRQIVDMAKNLRRLQESIASSSPDLTQALNTARLIEQGTLPTIADQQAFHSETPIEEAVAITQITIRHPTPAGVHVLSEIEEQHRPSSPSSNTTAAPSRASSPSPSVGSNATSTNEASRPSSKDSEELESKPNWSGCLAFCCPMQRAMGDHRRRCTGIMRECQDCKVFVCGLCIDAMLPACKCDECTLLIAVDGIGPRLQSTVAEMRFWCPNCRWERYKDGRCKKRLAHQAKDNPDDKAESTGKGKGNAKRALLMGRATRHTREQQPPQFSGIRDVDAQCVEDFFRYLSLTGTDSPHATHNMAAAGPLPESNEADRVRPLVQDLARRLRRLRAHLVMSRPDLVRTTGSGESQSMTSSLPAPMVEDMD